MVKCYLVERAWITLKEQLSSTDYAQQYYT